MIHISETRLINIISIKGFWAGFKWIHCNGETSKTSALIASYHHPKSITWRWSLSWSKKLSYDKKWLYYKNNNGVVFGFSLPIVGGLTILTQKHMFDEKND